MNNHIIWIGSVLIVVCLVTFFNLRAAKAQSSANYSLKKISSRGGTIPQSTNHGVTDAVGQ